MSVPGSPDQWAAGLKEALTGARRMFDGHRPPSPRRRGRGDVRIAILALLAEQPMHGYQLIHEITRRTGGTWRPSPGSVYPTLQALADEGLVTAAKDGERKRYSITEAGRAAGPAEGDPLPWCDAPADPGDAPNDPGTDDTALPAAGLQLVRALALVVQSGTPQQVANAAAVLDDARRKVFAILAQR